MKSPPVLANPVKKVEFCRAIVTEVVTGYHSGYAVVGLFSAVWRSHFISEVKDVNNNPGKEIGFGKAPCRKHTG